MELLILIGLQASGKSTFRRSRFDDTHCVVSKDDFPNNRRPARRQERLRDALECRKPVVVDNTNPRREDRQPLIELARELRRVRVNKDLSRGEAYAGFVARLIASADGSGETSESPSNVTDVCDASAGD
jgi:hypothetical protein